MKLTVRIRELSYPRLLLRVMALMEKSPSLQDTAPGKTFGVLSALPEDRLETLLEAIPEETKNELLAAFFRDYHDRILHHANRLLERQQTGIVLSSLQLSPEPELTVRTAEICWPRLVEKFLPAVREKLLTTGGIPALFGPVIARASPEELCRMADRIPGMRKEALLVSLAERNSGRLIAAAEDFALRQNIPLKIESISLQE